MKRVLVDSLIAGACGAASVLVTDAIVTRIDPINRSRVAMGLSRVSMGVLGAIGLERLDAPSSVTCGVASGPVMMVTIEAFIAAIPRRRPEISPSSSMRELAQPWTPSI